VKAEGKAMVGAKEWWNGVRGKGMRKVVKGEKDWGVSFVSGVELDEIKKGLKTA
jgi:hypothetical protein